MIWAVVAVVALVSGATTAALAVQQADPSVSVAIDVITDGNSGNSLGEIDSCREASVGDTFEIDVTVMDVPPVADDPQRLGIAGFGFNLNFDPAVINVTGAVNDLMIGRESPFERIQANYERGGPPNDFPATTGNLRIDYLDLGQDFDDGDGILSRLAIEVVGAGTTTLHLDSQIEGVPTPVVFQALGEIYGISSQQDAVIAVGEPCEVAPTPFEPPDASVADDEPDGDASVADDEPGGETPDPEGTPSGTESATPSSVPIGDTEIAVDTVTTGNEAMELGPLDECAAADTDESFYIDVTVRDVEDLLAFELPVSFDPEVLQVEDRNVDLFLAAEEGSNVLDASNQTPNATGLYMSAAVDQSDPPDPNSGSGVLVRLTFSAVGAGSSVVSVGPIDLTDDEEIDRAVLLKNVDNAVVGDTDGDSWFDGPVTSAEILVGEECDSGAHVVQVDSTSGPDDEDDGDSNNWIWIVAGLAIVIAVVGIGGAYYVQKRRRPASPL